MDKIDIDLLFSNLMINIQQREDILYLLRTADITDSKRYTSISQQYTELTIATQGIIDQIRSQIDATDRKNEVLYKMVNSIVNKF